MDKIYIKLTDPEVVELCNQDPTMKKLISSIGNLEIDMRPDYFRSLVRSIVGQLISVQAAEAIFHRLDLLLENKITAESILQTHINELRHVGLSNRKVAYIQDLAWKVSTSTINLQQLHSLDNREIIKQLTSIKGIGKWTSEMFLIFSLGRMDVLAIDDIGTQRGAAWLYQGNKADRRKILKEKATLWEPHYTIASFYLWEAVLLGYVTNYDSIDELD